MNKVVLKRLWFPFILFGVFAASAFFSKDFLFQFGAEAISQTQKVLGYVIQIGIWFSAAHFLNRLIIIFFWDGLVRRAIGAPVPRLLKDVLTIVIYLIAVTAIVGVVFGKSVTGFWATSGAVGLILGFALRNMILDVFTGIAINIDRPYKIGDWITAHGSKEVTGQVTEINWRTTRLYTVDDSIVIVPNSLLGNMVVTNFWGGGEHSRFETTFCLDFSVPTERAFRVMQAGAKAVTGQKGILEQPEPKVIINKTTELGIEYKVRFWMSAWVQGITLAGSRSLVNNSVLAHLKQAGITPAYPKQDLYYAEMPVRHLDASTVEDRAELLSQTALFKHMDKKELKQLAANMNRKKYDRGEKLIQQGENGASMFILSEGLLHAFISTNGEEGEIKVGQIIPGQFFGEMSLLTGEQRSATIVAMTEVIAHEITKDNINGLLKKRPRLAETMSKVVAERKVLNSQAMATASLEERIEETESLARQIMGKMKSFFKGIF